MKLNVAAEAKIPGRIGKYVEDVQYDSIEYLGSALVFAKPIHIEAEYTFDGDGFNVKGTLDTMLLSQCSKCGKEYDEPMHIVFDERFERGGGGEDDDVYSYIGDEIDLSQMVSDSLLLNYSPYGVCSEDCKGLCPVCGCDLNTAQCDCATRAEDTSSPLYVLKTLLNDDKEV